MNGNGRPLTTRTKVRILVALTILAWATAAGVQRPSRRGTIPSRHHRRSVPGETSSWRATSFRVGSGMPWTLVIAVPPGGSARRNT